MKFEATDFGTDKLEVPPPKYSRSEVVNFLTRRFRAERGFSFTPEKIAAAAEQAETWLTDITQRVPKGEFRTTRHFTPLTQNIAGWILCGGDVNDKILETNVMQFDAAEAAKEYELNAKGLGYKYHSGSAFTGRSVTLFENVNLRFAPASVTAVIGPNGVGKTSLLNTLKTKARESMNHRNWNVVRWLTEDTRGKKKQQTNGGQMSGSVSVDKPEHFSDSDVTDEEAGNMVGSLINSMTAARMRKAGFSKKPFIFATQQMPPELAEHVDTFVYMQQGKAPEVLEVGRDGHINIDWSGPDLVSRGAKGGASEDAIKFITALLDRGRALRVR